MTPKNSDSPWPDQRAYRGLTGESIRRGGARRT